MSNGFSGYPYYCGEPIVAFAKQMIKDGDYLKAIKAYEKCKQANQERIIGDANWINSHNYLKFNK